MGDPDDLVELAALLEVDADLLRAGIGGPWSLGQVAEVPGGELRVYVGRENPRMEGRPLVAIRVDTDALQVDVGKAVGVPVPDGRMQWALGQPRRQLLLDTEADDIALVSDLQDAINAIADAAMLRGSQW